MGADCWVVTDGAAGNEKQALALARALGHEPDIVLLAARAPWRWFAPRIVAGASRAFGGDVARRLRDSPPALAIGCGRQAALALQLLKRAHGARCRCVQVLDPRIDPSRFDVVVVPAHDALRGENVVVARGALHEVDDAWLARARIDWSRFAALPAPRTAVLLGGSNAALTIDENYWRGLAGKLGQWLTRDGGSLLLTTSRRSPDWLRDAARAEFSAVPGVQWHGADDGANPYPGLLAWADRIVVTPESVNLLSEACATPAPVLFHLDAPLRGKIGGFLGDLVRSDRVRPMQADYAPWAVQPLRDTAEVAAKVRARLG